MKRMALPRHQWLPQGIQQTAPFRPEGTDLEIWAWENQGLIRAIAFAGQANKPLWDYRFLNLQMRQERIEGTIEANKASLEYKAAKKREKAEFRHSLKVGDILSCSWGYEQTQVDFYEVVSVKAGTVEIREIGKTRAEEDRVIPLPGQFTGEVMTKRPSVGNVLKMTSYSSAYLWNGKACYETPWHQGH